MTGIEAGKAYVKFVLEDSQLKKSLANVGKKLQGIGKLGMTATAPLVAGFAAATAAFVTAGDELDKMSQRTGIGVEALSELKYAAGQSGTSIGSIEKAVKKMQLGIVDAARGSGTLFEALKGLGVTMEDLKGQSPEQQFLTLSRAIANVEDPTLRAGLAQQVFGRAGTELLPLLAQGADGMDQLRQRAHDLGLTLDDEAATSAAVLGDNLDDVKQQFYFMAVQVGAAIAGPLTNFLKWMQGALGSTIAWIKQHPTLIKNLAIITSVAAGVSAAIYAIGTALTIITLHPIVAFLALLAGVIVAIASYFSDASDSADEFSGSLDKVEGSQQRTGTSPEDIRKIEQQAAALQSQVQMSMPTTQNVSMDQAAITSLDQLLGDAVRDTARSSKEMVTILREMLRRMTGGGGLVAGAG